MEIAGARIGRLTLVRPVAIGGRCGWLCLCECGKDVEARTDRLRSGKTQSCGCLKADIGAERWLYVASRRPGATAEQKAAYFRHLWRTKGSLYGERDDAAMCRASFRGDASPPDQPNPAA